MRGRPSIRVASSLSPVKIGNYNISATAGGFQTTTQDKVQLQLGERLNVPITLKPGAVSQTVEVTDAPLLLQTSRLQLARS